MKIIITIIICALSFSSFSQSLTRRALFLGNSYTYVNNLPQLVADVAASAGDSLYFDSNANGGYTLQQHSTDVTSLSKIMQGNWDYVVLQEQSQLPSFPIAQVETDVFPYAHALDSIINIYNTCGETVFYMTWGREYGDSSNCASWPPVCTYSGMDSLLNLRYRMMADSNRAILSPVGAVWNYIRQNFPSINLYQSDQSHPSVEGSYTAACCFYTTLFRKNPLLITFNSSLDSTDAINIRNAVKTIVFDSLMNWNIGEYDPHSNFSYIHSGGRQITFTNNAVNALDYFWDFGDGDTSTVLNPTHLYLADGSYLVSLISINCDKQDTLYQTIIINTVGFSSPEDKYLSWDIYPNPASTSVYINTTSFKSISFKIINFLGEDILNSQLNNTSKTIPISTLSNGIYILQLFEDSKLIGQRRFVKSGF